MRSTLAGPHANTDPLHPAFSYSLHLRSNSVPFPSSSNTTCDKRQPLLTKRTTLDRVKHHSWRARNKVQSFLSRLESQNTGALGTIPVTHNGTGQPTFTQRVVKFSRETHTHHSPSHPQAFQSHVRNSKQTNIASVSPPPPSDSDNATKCVRAEDWTAYRYHYSNPERYR
ncbi:hypothetical protein FCIRC_6385 [Fusarium circinatum]|uniref:Uncharacterized protein n=1 Tax=Fusarium circinatum TaxID=48490 RepID=A0A8H5TYU0_FUSCI|nr:hypothetical protein FCIRC_6385 [Fusarium circinatum]